MLLRWKQALVDFIFVFVFCIIKKNLQRMNAANAVCSHFEIGSVKEEVSFPSFLPSLLPSFLPSIRK